MQNAVHLLMLMFALAIVATGQSFSSGSTGVDGALDVNSAPYFVQLPDSGVLNYTTVNIGPNAQLYFRPNLRNTPVVMLAQGAIQISGVVNLDADGRTPGPGGFYGGDFGYPGSGWPGPGFGPGGGAAGNPQGTIQENAGKPGQWIGPLSLVPNIGGSGGGASSTGWVFTVCGGPGYGGGGGGAITIASSTSIVLSGAIAARGVVRNCMGSGADGAIRLVANSINVTGNLTAAVARLEAPLNAITYTGNGTAPVRSTVNPLIAPSNPPMLSFVSIGGYQVPAYSGSSFSTIDLLLPTQLQDPIPVVVRGTNVPVGSQISLTFSGSGRATSTTATLTGTTSSSTATLYIAGLTRSAVTYLFVLATFDPALIADNLRQSGPNAVSRVEVASALGETTTYRFLRRDGTEINMSTVSADLKRALGL